MALVAVLSARSMTESASGGTGSRRRAELEFAGQSLVEYQARQAHAAGAAHVLVLVDDISPVLTAMVDHLSADGIHASLIRDLPGLGRMMAPSDRVLMIGDGHILPSPHIELLPQGEGNRILILPSGPATQGFERIDAHQMWAGALVVAAPVLLGILDMLGDWDLPLTLLRQAVQEGSARVTCEMADVFDGRIVIATNQQVADAATQTLARASTMGGAEADDSDDWPVGKPAAAVAPLAIRNGIAPAMLRNLGIGLGLLGVVAILGGLVMLGCLLCFAGLVSDRVGRQLDRLLRLASGKRPVDHVMAALALVAILATGVIHGGDGALAGAGAVLCTGLLALAPAIRRKGMGQAVPAILKFAPGTALLLLSLGALFNAIPTMFAICALLAFASHVNQLLRV